MAFFCKSFGFLSSILLAVSAASFPPVPEQVSTVLSTHFPGRSISYKETDICETTEGVKSYSGYVNLPANATEGRAYEAHMYFWFFEARNDPANAPLSLWLQGGPGVPSINAALGENGPCSVNDDSKSTTLNPWSWNDKVNMLYVDQPVQVSFSYNTLVNGTLDEMNSPFMYKPQDFTKNALPETNLTFLTGTFATPILEAASNTTIATAPAMWDFMQTWIQEFPEYRPKDDKFSIWTESYGGHYAPVYSDYFEKQNQLIAAGTLPAPAIQLRLDTIGLVNACIDIDTQMPTYPEFAFNNTYGIQAINTTQYRSAVESTATCKNMTSTCKALADEQDPKGLGNNPTVNKACLGAYLYCFSNMHDGYDPKRNPFDITAPALEAFPTKWSAGYLNSAEVQQALGVPVNFTGNSMVIASEFNLTGDFVRGHGLENLSTLLGKGIKIALVYGDRDYQCNWLGGEAISLAIKSNTTTDSGFKNAGYTDIQTNATYSGGLVRQYGNLSFARVYQAGHEVPYYQPETAYQIFNRVMFNTDVATGKQPAAGYSSTGAESAFTQSEVPPPEGPAPCYLWDIAETCTPVHRQIISNGTAIVKNFILVGQKLANGSEVFFTGGSGTDSNGTTGAAGGSNGTSAGAGSSYSGPANQTVTSAANSVLASGVRSPWALPLSVAVFVGFQACVF